MQIKGPPCTWFGSCFYMWLFQLYIVPLEIEELMLKLLLWAELCVIFCAHPTQIHMLES